MCHTGSALLGFSVFCMYSDGSCHTRSALPGGVVLPVSCWELVCHVCPTESLGPARILLGISQSLVSYWELVHLVGLSPTGSQCITCPLGVSSSYASCWQSGHQLGASQVSPLWLELTMSHVSCQELVDPTCPFRSVCVALQPCLARSQCSVCWPFLMRSW